MGSSESKSIKIPNQELPQYKPKPNRLTPLEYARKIFEDLGFRMFDLEHTLIQMGGNHTSELTFNATYEIKCWRSQINYCFDNKLSYDILTNDIIHIINPNSIYEIKNELRRLDRLLHIFSVLKSPVEEKKEEVDDFTVIALRHIRIGL